MTGSTALPRMLRMAQGSVLPWFSADRMEGNLRRGGRFAPDAAQLPRGENMTDIEKCLTCTKPECSNCLRERYDKKGNLAESLRLRRCDGEAG